MPMSPSASRRTRTPWRAGAVAALLVAAAACGGDGGTGPNEDAAGRYEIVQVNDDRTPPFTLFAETVEGTSYRLDLVSGSLTLDGDGTYVSRATARLVVDGQSQGDQVSPPQTGRYTVSGSTVVFDPSGNDPEEPNFEADRDGDTLTLSQTAEDPDTGVAVTITIVAQR